MPPRPVQHFASIGSDQSRRRRLAERIAHLGTSHLSGRLFWGGVKDFVDGSLGSRTALFHDPYAGAYTQLLPAGPVGHCVRNATPAVPPLQMTRGQAVCAP